MKKPVIIFIVAVLNLVWSCSGEKVDEYAMVTFMLGDVLRNDSAIEIGDILKEKDVIKTAADSFCDVRIGGSIIRIKEKSALTMTTLIRKGNKEDVTLGLAVGKMLCKPKKLLKSEKFVVKTPTAVAGVRGTNFVVEADKNRTTRIKVFQGKVKVARRVKQFDKNVDEVLEVSSAVEKEKKVIITEAEVKKAEKNIERAIKKSEATGTDIGTAQMLKIIEENKKVVSIEKTKIESFAVEDFQKENKEIIAVGPKEPAVIKRIVKAIQQEKKKPVPEGRLLVTRYEIYFIKNGKVLWEGEVVDNPLKKNDRIYIASGNFVFCASSDGPVMWRRKLTNNGKLELKDDRLVVDTGKGKAELDIETGEKI